MTFLRVQPSHPSGLHVLELIFGLVIGAASFAGSLVAFAKLQELLTGRPITYPGQQWRARRRRRRHRRRRRVDDRRSPPGRASSSWACWPSALGAGICLPVGGADTPVLISLLNSLTGLAVAADGFALDNLILVVAGTLVGTSGALLTKMMSDAMGRSLAQHHPRRPAERRVHRDRRGGGRTGRVRSADATDIGTLLAYSRRVLIVPGYGLAVAQAQHTVVELAQSPRGQGVEVAYAIHPVAGRMPGHMNVLLAEADVPYESLDDLDAANAKFSCHRRGAGGRRQRRGQPGGPGRSDQPAVRHADPQRRPGRPTWCS